MIDNYSNFKKGVISGGAYFLVTIMSVVVFALPNSNLRISNALQPLIGIVFGVPGAIGAFFGNFASDCICYPDVRENPIVYIVGSIGTALYVLLYYKMFNSKLFNYSDVTQATHTLRVKGMLKCILCFFIVSITTSTYVCLDWVIFAEKPFDYELYKAMFFNSMEIDVILAMPFILYYTRKCYNKRLHESREISSGVSVPIQTKIIAIAFIFITASIIFDAYNSIIVVNKIESDIMSKWIKVEEMLLGVGNVSYLIMLVGLYLTEEHIVDNVNILSNYAKKLAKYDYINHDIRKDFISIDADNELNALANAMNGIAGTLQTKLRMLNRSNVAKEKVETEFSVALRIQTSILPAPTEINSIYKGVFISAKMQPAWEVGGDFYDFGKIDNNRFYILIADVSGKGVPAAMFMVAITTMIRSKIRDNLSPDAIISKANNCIVKYNPEMMFATCFFGVYNVPTRELQYVNAGHTRPLLFHKTGEPEYIKKKSGPMMATIEDIPYKLHKKTLAEGDLLVLFTDGVTEAENINHELFEYERLMNVAMSLKTEEQKQDAVVNIYDAIKKYAEGAPQSDDITLLSLYVK